MPAAAPIILTESLPSAVSGLVYLRPFNVFADGFEGNADDGTQGQFPGLPVTMTVTGLPPGMYLDDKALVLRGTPTAAGTYTLGCTVTNPAGSTSKTLTLVVLHEGSARPQTPGFPLLAGGRPPTQAGMYWLPKFQPGSATTQTGASSPSVLANSKDNWGQWLIYRGTDPTFMLDAIEQLPQQCRGFMVILTTDQRNAVLNAAANPVTIGWSDSLEAHKGDATVAATCRGIFTEAANRGVTLQYLTFDWEPGGDVPTGEYNEFAAALNSLVSAAHGNALALLGYTPGTGEYRFVHDGVDMTTLPALSEFQNRVSSHTVADVSGQINYCEPNYYDWLYGEQNYRIADSEAGRDLDFMGLIGAANILLACHRGANQVIAPWLQNLGVSDTSVQPTTYSAAAVRELIRLHGAGGAAFGLCWTGTTNAARERFSVAAAMSASYTYGRLDHAGTSASTDDIAIDATEINCFGYRITLTEFIALQRTYAADDPS